MDSKTGKKVAVKVAQKANHDKVYNTNFVYLTATHVFTDLRKLEHCWPKTLAQKYAKKTQSH